MVTYEDFAKIELKIGKIEEAVPVDGSEKLVRLQVDTGEAMPRQILSGIIKYYSPENLIGKQVVIITNLEPRSIMGFESQGMLLAADSENGPVILMPEKEVASGAKIK